jgi:hypothetical protein
MSSHFLLTVRLVLILSVLDAYSIEAGAQNLKGLWNGRITTDNHDASGSYIINIEEQKDGVISGKALMYKPNVFSQAFGLQQFFGTVEKDQLTITDVAILDEKMPASMYFLCFKLSNLSYTRKDSVESLTGSWSSSSPTCYPGKIYLLRYNAQTDKVPPYVLNAIKGTTDKPMFRNTEITSPVVLNVKNYNLELELKDYLRTDNDTISIYLNRKLILNKLNISRRPFKFNIRLNRNLASNELILYANNLGYVPPNTSLLQIYDGQNRHRVLIESTLQKSVAIYLKRSP